MKRLSAGMTVCLLAACATAPDDAGTIKSLERQQVAIERDVAVSASRAAAAEAYRHFLDAAPQDRYRPEALRRLGDIEIENAEAEDNGKFDPAIKTYEDLLRAHPQFAGNDHVLYQLAHAYDQGGNLKRALATLDRLVTQYPTSAHRAEAEFRRGELLFTLRDYEAAERAYRSVLQQGESSPFYERALYMRGWSLFKQDRLEDGLPSFFAVLDRKLAGDDASQQFEQLARADRELVEDTFRVMSLSLANLQGAESIPRFTGTGDRRSYEYLVYQQLGDLYNKQERVKDAADTLNAFARRFPTHPQAPLLQARVIQMYQQAKFATLALEMKKEYVVRYGKTSEFHAANSADVYAQVLPLLKTHLDELGRHYHAEAQRSKTTEDYREAARWYRAYIESFPDDAQTPAINFLLAESLFESKRFSEAAAEYERVANDYQRHDKSADAGYAALLAYAEQEKTIDLDQRQPIRLQAIDSALRFSAANPNDSRRPGVLTDAAEKLYALKLPERAVPVAQLVLALKPPAASELRRTAWTVIAHAEFDKGEFDRAEGSYQQVLALTPEQSPTRAGLNERLAASIYKQGEQAQAGGDLRAAADHFLRLGREVPTSPIRVNAEYDAASALITLKDWAGATKILEAFRKNYPTHALQAEVPGKLAVCYLEGGQPLKAAAEFEVLASSKKDVGFSRDALWRAAELYEKAGNEHSAATAYERYVRQHPRPLEPAIEARYRLMKISEKQGDRANRYAWSRELIDAEQKGGSERSERTRNLGALTALAMTEPLEAAYRDVRLVEPLKKSLKIKKQRMQELLKAYSIAADYGAADIVTTATFRTADLYHDFSKALLSSQRPKGLKGDELEQYNVLLEEQAFPFEEKAIEIHELNAHRMPGGIYDQWVKKSLSALGQLRPVRYAKTEKSEKVIDELQ
ncbi:MAG: tetratricopeptide repeat protein [Gammaproteobacteria bacterium]|nr:tetratricopeptide repeat protein [Gammaproteobacteria bacterium]